MRHIEKLIAVLTITGMLSECVKVNCSLDLKPATPMSESANPTPIPSPEATSDPSSETNPSEEVVDEKQ